MTQVAFAPDVFTWPSDEPQLIGGRCPSCAAVAFPLPSACPRCGSTDVERHLLPRRGTLYTWTTQDFLPKEPYASGETPETFRPYGVGLVQLGDEVRVEARLTESDPQALEAEALAQSVNSQTRDLQEAMAAFVERRPPRFEGR